jgi:hypothetical protein
MKINHLTYTHLFSIIFIAQSLSGMQRPVPCTTMTNVVTIVPGLTAPRSVGCVGKNGIAVLEENSFVVWDTKEQKHIIQQKGAMHDFAISPHKQEPEIVLCNGGILRVYNSCTGKQERLPDLYANLFLANTKNISVAFNNTGNIICYGKEDKRCLIYSDSIPNIIQLTDMLFGDTNNVFDHHPLKQEILYGGSDDGYFCYWYTENIHTKSPKLRLNNDFSVREDCSVIGQLYNNDGSRVVTIEHGVGETTMSFFAHDDGLAYIYLDKAICLQKLYIAIAFHPNNKWFFALDDHNTIDCFDYATQESIIHVHAIHCAGEKNIPVRGLEKRLALSERGTEMFAALESKVLKYRLPFALFCRAAERKHLFAILEALHCYDDDGFVLPGDVVYTIMKKTLKLYRNDAINKM